MTTLFAFVIRGDPCVSDILVRVLMVTHTHGERTLAIHCLFGSELNKKITDTWLYASQMIVLYKRGYHF